MRTVGDQTHALDSGLAAIRQQYDVPTGFPPAIVAAAERAAANTPTEHVDRTDWPFVTLDPASSTDLDQAFTIETSGSDLLLHYAIADVAWFVRDGDVVDAEAWQRGNTLYLPDGKAGLYPSVLSEGVASLLPDGPRPAVVFHVRLSSDGHAALDGAERAIIRSRAKLAYEAVQPDQLPVGFDEFARRVAAAEQARGAGPIRTPEQEVERHDGGYRLQLRPRLASETANSALSLATNLAVADAMLHAGVGLFRVMSPPDQRALKRLRHTARAFGLSWANNETLEAFSRQLDPNQPEAIAFMMAVRRAGGSASYVVYEQGVTPWHAAMAATYAHVTAPLRRLADRYVVQIALALANAHELPERLLAALPRLPDTMERAQATGNRIDRAVLDLAEAVVMQGREGEVFEAVVVDDDDDATQIQLKQAPIVAKVQTRSVRPGDELRVRLVAVDIDRRLLAFDRVS